jgi:hypothetical protein
MPLVCGAPVSNGQSPPEHSKPKVAGSEVLSCALTVATIAKMKIATALVPEVFI